MDLDALHGFITCRSPDALAVVTCWLQRIIAAVERERAHGNEAPVVVLAGDNHRPEVRTTGEEIEEKLHGG